MKTWLHRAAVLSVAWLAAASAAAQTSRYDMYGPVVDVTIADLANSGIAYTNRAVRTKGWLERDMGVDQSTGGTGAVYRLRDTGGYTVGIRPVPDIQDAFESESSQLLGRRVEITGLFEEQQGMNVDRTAGVINFWRFMNIPDPEDERLSKARKLTIEELATRPERHSGRTVKVVGEFRGHNLFEDLPVKSMRKRSDWVIHQGDHAIWVTGKKPRGDGWELDPALKRDSGKWIEVTGKIEAKDGIIYIKADRLLLSSPPAAVVVSAQPTTPPPERPRVPPIVVFSLPLDGDVEIPADSRFMVQFSEDMDESTFEGRVELRYVSAPRPGVSPLTAVSFVYGKPRSLTVDPGDRLGRGTEIELRLLPGIKDINGLELVPRNGTVADGIVDALRYRVE